MNVVIVGAGVVGCAIAYELASRGARVRLVESRGTGLGATRASAGILAPYIEGHIPALRSLGARSLAVYDSFIERVVADSGREIAYERTGTLQIAIDDGELAALCAAAHQLANLGVAHTMLDRAETRKLEPQLRSDVAGALLIPEQGYVAAPSLTEAMAAAAATRGAAITAAHVVSIHGGETPGVVTTDGRIEGDAVIVAAGSWSAAVAADGASDRDRQNAVRPIRGQLLQLRLASRPAWRVIWGSRCYLVPWPDGTVLAGATVENVGFDERATVSGVQDLLAESSALLPIVRTASFEGVRVGLRPMTRDELPAIGASSTMRRVFFATGHYRNGVLLAPLTAALVADLVLNGREAAELALVMPGRLGL